MIKLIDSKKKKPAIFGSLLFFTISAAISVLIVLTEENALATWIDKLLIFGIPLVFAGLAYLIFGNKESESNSVDA
jgi:uncharacterized membrane protein